MRESCARTVRESCARTVRARIVCENGARIMREQCAKNRWVHEGYTKGANATQIGAPIMRENGVHELYADGAANYA